MHPTDELLSTYACDPASVEDAAELETHLEGCPSCQKRVDAFREIETLLADPQSWADLGDGTPVRAPEAMSRISARNRREDAEADALLTAIIDRFLDESSVAFAWANIALRREYHTAGVVRKLADAADKAQYSVPRRALILAETASQIVGMLSTTTYTATEIAALRGLSWKQQANANRQLGRFNAAMEALNRAERAYRELRLPELDLASITFIRATVFFEQQQYDAAEQYANKSTAAFEQLRQTEPYFGSRYLQGCIAFEQRQLGEAQLIFDSVFAHGEGTTNASWMARASLALGHCHLERRELTTASEYFHQAMLAFRETRNLSGEIQCRWGLARLVQRDGRYGIAIQRLRDVREEFGNLGAVSDAALVTLDIMETFLLLGKTREVRQTAGHIVQLFKDAGMVTGALTAADYLKHAASMSSITPNLIEYVRKYLRRVDVQPDLAFVPPTAL